MRPALLSLSVLVAAACAEIPCPGGCPAGQLCDEATGRCVPPPDCTVVGCPEADEVCDALTGECRPVDDCLTAGCPPTQTCNTRTHRCEARQGCVVYGCPGDLVCDPAAGLCRTRPCRRDNACPAGQVCAASGDCVAGCRVDRACPAGSVCSVLLLPEPAGDAVGQCLTGCRDHADCPHGALCTPDPQATPPLPGLCTLEPPCGSRADCRADEICDRGTCVRGPCTEGVPCPPGAFCDPETGDCLSADCTDDTFEDNDGPDDAYDLLPQAYTQLSLCPGDADWYRVEPGPGAWLDATLRLDPARGDLDLVAWDGDLRQLAASRTTGSPEVVRVQAGPSGEVMLEVHGHGGASNLYFLEIATRPPPECEDDALGENGSFRTPHRLPPGTYEGLVLCPGTEDWFALDLQQGDGLEVSLAAGQGPLPALERLGPDGSRERAETLADIRSLRLARVRHGGEHLLRVGPAGEESSVYALDVRTHPDGLPCRDDDLEDNDTPETASPVVGTAYSALVACPGDADWFSLELERPGSGVVVRLHAPGVEPEALPDLEVLDPAGARAQRTAAEDGLVATVDAVDRAGAVLVRVELSSEALPVPYELEVAVTPGPEPCRDDSLEPEGGNDAAAWAVLIRPGVIEGLVLCPDSPEDWFSVDVAQGGALRLRVEGEGLRCGLRTPDGARLVQACEESGQRTRSVARLGLDRGRYRLRVQAPVTPPGLPYRLELEVLP